MGVSVDALKALEVIAQALLIPGWSHVSKVPSARRFPCLVFGEAPLAHHADEVADRGAGRLEARDVVEPFGPHRRRQRAVDVALCRRRHAAEVEEAGGELRRTDAERLL